MSVVMMPVGMSVVCKTGMPVVMFMYVVWIEVLVIMLICHMSAFLS